MLQFMKDSRLVQAVQALMPRWTGRDQDHLVGLADAAAGAAYDAAFDHIEVLEDFRTDLQSPVGASLIGTVSDGNADLQTVLDTLRDDINSVGGGGGSYAEDADVVHKTGSLNETITGIKTFTSNLLVNMVNAIVGIGDGVGGRQGGLTCYGTNEVGIFTEAAGGTIRIRPNGRTSSTNEIVITNGTVTVNGIEMGYRSLPRVTTFNADANGKMVATASNLTIDTGPEAGTLYSIYNNSASGITITQGAGMTLRLAGTSNVGSRNLAARGLATIWFNSTTEAICSGVGLT